MLSLSAWFILFATLLALPLPAAAQSALPLDQIQLPPGFEISLYAEAPSARSLALGAEGTVFVSTRDIGVVYAVTDTDGDLIGETVRVIARGLDLPNGIAFYEGDLYVALRTRILRYPGIEAQLDSPPEPEVIYTGFINASAHSWKYLRVGPDGKLYVPVGFPCNVCEDSPDYGLIMRMNLDGTEPEVVARGIRNTVGFDFHPESGALWFTDNGRDNLGDDVPPDELNVASEPGLHFGFPYCHGGTIPDPQFNGGRSCDEFAPPALNLPAHVAALGARFYTGAMFPPDYQNQLFIAEHGSWNRSVPQGYRVSLVQIENGEVVGYEPFAEGWLQGSQFWGRPVDALVMPDGALLVSDDYAGVV